MKILRTFEQFEEDKNEEFKFGGDTPYKRYGKDFIQNLISKAKKLIPQERIDQFIEDNKDEVEKLANQLSDDKGDIDYDKVTEFINKNKK